MKKLLVCLMCSLLIFNACKLDLMAYEEEYTQPSYYAVDYDYERILMDVYENGYALVPNDYDISELPVNFSIGALTIIAGWGATAVIHSYLLPIISTILTSGLVMYNLPTLVELAESIYIKMDATNQELINGLVGLEEWEMTEELHGALSNAISSTVYDSTGALIGSLGTLGNYGTKYAEESYRSTEYDSIPDAFKEQLMTEYNVYYPIPDTSIELMFTDSNTLSIHNTLNGITVTFMNMNASGNNPFNLDGNHLIGLYKPTVGSYSNSKSLNIQIQWVEFCGKMIDSSIYSCSSSHVRHYGKCMPEKSSGFAYNLPAAIYGLEGVPDGAIITSQNWGSGYKLESWTFEDSTIQFTPATTLLGYATGVLDDSILGAEGDIDVDEETGQPVIVPPAIGGMIKNPTADMELDKVTTDDLLNAGDIDVEGGESGEGGILATIGSTLTKLWEEVKGLLASFVDKMMLLFVPSAEFFETWFLSLYEIFSNQLGILIAPFDVLFNLMQRFMTLEASNACIYIPSIKDPVYGVNFIPETTFCMESILNNSTFAFLHNTYLMVVDVILWFMFLNHCLRKFNSVVGKGGN